MLIAFGACGTTSRDGDRSLSGELSPGQLPADRDQPWFEEIQAQAGLDFAHVHGGSGQRYMIETMIGGGGFLDFDGDGWLDIYAVQGGPLPGFADQRPLPNRLFRNRGGGTFEDVTDSSGSGDTGYGVGTCFGDFDNDGRTDIYVTNLGQDTLLHNTVDGFENATSDAGINSPRYGSSCAFADYDQDGCLDLLVVNFVDFALDNHRECGNPALRTYCSPDAYNGLPDQLYRNRCDGTFEDVSERAGIANQNPNQSKGLGVVWSDLDDDGDVDIYIANDSTRNFFYRNNGDGTFDDIALQSGTAFNDRGVTEASMGVDAGDFDGDGRLDLFMTHLDFETNTLYRNLGDQIFLDATTLAALAAPSATRVGFGTSFFDHDHDGDLDLFVANGHILDNIEQRNATLRFEQPNQLFENRGGRFVDASADAGPHFATARVSRAAATGDLDNDGDLDLLIINSNDGAVLLANRLEQRADLTGRHWLGLRLLSRFGGRDAIGTRVRVVAGEHSWVDETRSGASYLSQSDPRLHVGLGAVTEIDRLEIRWPEGDTQTIPGSSLVVDRYHEISQPTPNTPAAEESE